MSSSTQLAELASLHKWLALQGYPLELRVGRLLREGGWHVEHARWFADPETDKLRELDIKAERWIGGEDNATAMSVELVVECKSSVGKPWVAFTTPRENVPSILRPTAVADPFSRDAMRVAVSKKLSFPDLLRPRGRLAHGLVKAHSEGKSGDPTSPFAAVQGALAASRAIGKENAEMALMWAEAGSVSVVIPVIVLDGALYEYSVADDGTESLVETNRVAVPSASTSRFSAAVVWVLQVKDLGPFMQELWTTTEPFVKGLLPHASEVIKLLRNRVDRERKQRLTPPE